MKHFHELEETINISLNNKVNECSLHLDSKRYDNYTREFQLTFDFKGELQNVDIIQDKNYYVYREAIIANNESAYWSNLVIQAIMLQKENKFDNALLFLFSAFDNYITLKISKLTNSFYKEFNIENMEFSKKVSILLKHYLNVNPGQNEQGHEKRLRWAQSSIEKELYEVSIILNVSSLETLMKDTFNGSFVSLYYHILDEKLNDSIKL